MTGTPQQNSQATHSVVTRSPSLPIRLHFATNWGVSTGVSSRGIANSTVETDQRGFPLVRATTLTGILREQAELVAESLDVGLTAAPDGHEERISWQDFVSRLFGARGQARGADDSGPGLSEGTSARLIAFSDATVSEDTQGDSADSSSDAGATASSKTSVVGIQIDPTTGTVKDDFFRSIERATATDLYAHVSFLDVDHAGNQLTWDDEQRTAVRFILSLAATLVRGIGSDRSVGDGQCTVLIGADTTQMQSACAAAEALKAWCIEQMNSYCPVAREGRVSLEPPALPSVSDELTQAPKLNEPATSSPQTLQVAESERHDGGGWVQMPLTVGLNSPVVSYDVPMSNEVRTLDFIRGTVLLPWVHRRLRAAAPDKQIVRDAVVAGDLFVSDATLISTEETVGPNGQHSEKHGEAGVPVPLCLSRSKTEGENAAHVLNRLLEAPRKNEGGIAETHVPLRGGFLVTGDGTGIWDADSADENGKQSTIRLIKPQMTGRQSSAHNAVTGATANGQLFLVRALASGQIFGATVMMSPRLLRELDGVDVQRVLSGEARLGTRKLSGTYGQVTCRAAAVQDVPGRPEYWGDDGPWDEEGTTTLWCTSDLLVRSATLGHGGSIADIERALTARGATVEVINPQECAASPEDSTTSEHGASNSELPSGASTEPRDGECAGRDSFSDSCFAAVVRHRRVDSWSGGGNGEDGQPRPTRMAVQAGSVLRVKLVDGANRDSVTKALARIACFGLGDLRAQGYGRILVGHPLLREARINVQRPENTVEKGGQQQ